MKLMKKSLDNLMIPLMMMIIIEHISFSFMKFDIYVLVGIHFFYFVRVLDGEFEPVVIAPLSTPPELPDVMKPQDSIPGGDGS